VSGHGLKNEIFTWSGTGQYRPDRGANVIAQNTKGELDIRTALDDCARTAAVLSEAMADYARTTSDLVGLLRVLTGHQEAGAGADKDSSVPSPRPAVEPCPRRAADIGHLSHNWGPVGGVCPGV
jgi:hypothetical protein